MIILPLATRLASSLHTLTRPLRRRMTYAQLKQLDGHMLRDIGLTRIDVEAMRRMW